MSTVFKALSDPTRRRVLELLKLRPMNAGELSAQFSFSKPTMSAHFAVLREAGLVASEKQGKSVVYQLQISVLEEALLGFAQVFGWDLKDSNEESGQSPNPAQDRPSDPNPSPEREITADEE